MRWYLLSSPILRGNDFSVTAAGLRDTVRQVLLPLWNAWYFLVAVRQRRRAPRARRAPPADASDARARPLRPGQDPPARRGHDGGDGRLRPVRGVRRACASFLDVLTNWYIRRSRERFWDGDARRHRHAAHRARRASAGSPRRCCRSSTEEIHDGLHHGDAGARSVHLTDWPRSDELPADDELVATMDQVRDVCSATLSVRKAHGRRVRQPLATLTVAVARRRTRWRPFADLIADEVNVRDVELTDDVDAVAGQVLQVVPAAIGPRLGARHPGRDPGRQGRRLDASTATRSSPAATGWSPGSTR